MVIYDKDKKELNVPTGLGNFVTNNGSTPEEVREIAEEVVDEKLENYDTSDEVDSKINTAKEEIEAEIPSLEGYATEEYVDNALTGYTPTANFATINGSGITEGGNIVIPTGKPKYILNQTTTAERIALVSALNADKSKFAEAEFYHIDTANNRQVQLTSFYGGGNEIYFFGTMSNGNNKSQMYYIRVRSDGGYEETRYDMLKPTDFATINGSGITSGGNIVIEGGKEVNYQIVESLEELADAPDGAKAVVASGNTSYIKINGTWIPKEQFIDFTSWNATKGVEFFTLVSAIPTGMINDFHWTGKCGPAGSATYEFVEGNITFESISASDVKLVVTENVWDVNESPSPMWYANVRVQSNGNKSEQCKMVKPTLDFKINASHNLDNYGMSSAYGLSNLQIARMFYKKCLNVNIWAENGTILIPDVKLDISGSSYSTRLIAEYSKNGTIYRGEWNITQNGRTLVSWDETPADTITIGSTTLNEAQLQALLALLN